MRRLRSLRRCSFRSGYPILLGEQDVPDAEVSAAKADPDTACWFLPPGEGGFIFDLTAEPAPVSASSPEPARVQIAIPVGPPGSIVTAAEIREAVREATEPTEPPPAPTPEPARPARRRR